MHGIYSDPAVMRWVGDGAVGARDETEAMLREYIDHQRRYGFSCWAVVERNTGAVIGDAGLYTRPEGVELGYTLAQTHWGHGYGTEAAALSVEAAFGNLGLDELLALVRPENSRSVSVLERLGFARAGRLIAYGTDHLLYRLRRH